MAYLDYIRIGTWSLPLYTQMATTLMMWREGWRPGRFLQYHGHKNDQLFFGSAEQTGKQHFIVQASGSMAQTMQDSDEISHQLCKEGWYCTRIDIQRTLPMPEWWDVRDLADSLSNNKVTRSFIESDSGKTLYIGSRTSDKFIRLYEKNLDKPFLRLEYEIKGKLARAIYRSMFTDANSSINAVYNGLLVKQNLPLYVKSYYLDKQIESVDVRVAEHEADQRRRLAWLLTLEDTIRMMMGDHDIGHDTRQFIMILARYGQSIDTPPAYSVESS